MRLKQCDGNQHGNGFVKGLTKSQVDTIRKKSDLVDIIFIGCDIYLFVVY